MRQKLIISCLTLIFSVSLCSYASDLDVSEITLSSTNWGHQTASFKLSNSGEDYKFVVATSEIRFIDNKYESPRFTKKAYFIEPSSEDNLTLPVVISAGYGKIEINISFYDVIDTLDQVYDSQRFFTKSFPVEYQISEKLKNENIDEITLPKFVGDNSLFDNYFSRTLLVLIYNGKSLEEIAELCQTDTDFIKTVMTEYQEASLLNISGSMPTINFMTINKNLAEALIPSIDNTVDNLFEVVLSNFHGYDSVLVSLVSRGKLSADKNDALDLGTVLYQKYPVTLGLFLWDLLGREFINDGKPFNIFEGSEPCNAIMGDFMYMTIGEEKYIGDSYYYSTLDPNNSAIYCGLGQHNFKCLHGNQELIKKKRRVQFEYDINNPDQVYLYNENNVREALSVLMDGTIEHTENLKTQMDKIFAGSFYDTNNKGARYWCWDMVVTKLMKKFEEKNILKKENTRLFRLQKIEF